MRLRAFDMAAFADKLFAPFQRLHVATELTSEGADAPARPLALTEPPPLPAASGGGR